MMFTPRTPSLARSFAALTKLTLLGLLFSLPAHATFTQTQNASTSSCPSGTTCNVTVSATGAGHGILVAAIFSSTADQITSITGGGSYTLCPGSSGVPDGLHCSLNLPWWNHLGYTLSSTAGATTITVNLSTSQASWSVVVVEFSFTGSSIALDAALGNSIPACTSCTGLVLTPWITGSNDYIFQALGPLTTITACSAPYNAPGIFLASGNALAGRINTNSGTAPSCTQSSSGAVSVSAIAFKEIGAGGGGGAGPAGGPAIN
jgi:hypothetical protein